MMRYLSIFLISVFVFTACTSKPIFEKYHKQENNNWLRFSNQEFDIPIQRAGEEVAIYFKMRVTNETPFDDFPIYAVLNLPSGEKRYMEKKVILKKDLKFAGEAMDNGMYEITSLLWSNLVVTEKGTCHLKIESVSQKYDNPGISEVGIVVTKAQKAKKEE